MHRDLIPAAMSSQVSITELVLTHGLDILRAENMQRSQRFVSHGFTSCYVHSLSVTYLSVRLALALHIRCDLRSMTRGALLHDYYLYDWHDPDPSHRLHGFSHAQTALRNAEREFDLNPCEEDIIRKHMFPLNLRPPRYRESVLVCVADKLVALYETLCRRASFEWGTRYTIRTSRALMARLGTSSASY